MVISRIFASWFFFVSILFHTSLLAVIYGSETAVFVFPTVVFPAADSNNTMLGFGWFKNGFTLENSSTTCVFNCLNQVSGTLALNGGTLTLQQDLVLTGTSMIAGGGIIIGNDHTILLNPDSQFEPAQSFTLQNVVLQLSDDFNLGSTLTFDGNCQLSGDQAAFWLDEAWSNSGAGIILVKPNSWLYIYDLYLQNIVGSNIACLDDTGIITLKDVQWLQTGDFDFCSGAFNFYNQVRMMGDAKFIYQSGMVSTVLYESSLILDEGFTFSYDPIAFASRELLTFDDSSSELVLRGATLYATTTGLRLTMGKLIVDRVSALYSEGLVEAQAISFASTFTIQILPAATLDYLGGLVVYE